jgi:hypothetical protein
MKLAQITGIHIPSTIFTSSDTLAGDLASRAILFAIVVAGLYFFYILIASGISYMTSVGDEAKLRHAQKQLTNGGYGLLIVICSYFLMQIIQRITGLSIF